jgi:hypothetical protein
LLFLFFGDSVNFPLFGWEVQRAIGSGRSFASAKTLEVWLKQGFAQIAS